MIGYPVHSNGEKIWSVMYGFIDDDGNKRDECCTTVEARSIDNALRLAYDRLYYKMYSQHWQAFKIWDIGICNDNIW